MTFKRITGTRQFRMMANGRGEYFMVVHCADGSICEYGPFISGEDAIQCQRDIENPTYDVPYDEQGIDAKHADMLAALREALPYINDDPNRPDGPIARVVAAIAKAEAGR